MQHGSGWTPACVHGLLCTLACAELLSCARGLRPKHVLARHTCKQAGTFGVRRGSTPTACEDLHLGATAGELRAFACLRRRQPERAPTHVLSVLHSTV